MPIQEHTVAVQVILRLLMVLFAFGVLGGIVTNALILWRTKSLSTLPEEKAIPRSERMGRQFSRLSAFFIDTQFRPLRLAMVASVGLCVSSFALLLFIDGTSR